MDPTNDLPPSYFNPTDTRPPPSYFSDTRPPLYYPVEVPAPEPTITINLHFRLHDSPYLLSAYHAPYNSGTISLPLSSTFTDLQSALVVALQTHHISTRLNPGWKLMGRLYSRPCTVGRGFWITVVSGLSRGVLGIDFTVREEEVGEWNWEEILLRLGGNPVRRFGELEGLELVVWPVREDLIEA